MRPRTPASSNELGELHIRQGNGLVKLQLPLIAGIAYQIVPNKNAPITVSSACFLVRRRGWLESLFVRARSKWLVKPTKVLNFDRFCVFARGERAARSAFKSAAYAFRMAGLGLDDTALTRFPELLVGWAGCDTKRALPTARRTRPIEAQPRFAVVAHVYYADVWPDLASILDRIRHPFDLIVTTVPGREDLISSILRRFPDADIRVFENRGRDVRPFLALLEEGRLDRYRYVCKIHGKKSKDGGRAEIAGNIWRNRLLFDLIAAPGVIDRTLSIFDAHPDVGMVGSSNYRYPSPNYPSDIAWAENRQRVLQIAGEMGISEEEFTLDFFGGTMFWVRPEALEPLRRLHLTADFAEEEGKLDGALEHAVERLFSAATLASGFTLSSIDGLNCESAKKSVHEAHTKHFC